MKHINKIGVELEGGWDRTFSDCIIGGDSSVVVPEAPHYGELASAPMPPDEGLKWVAEHYPTYGNKSCGMHVHISVKSAQDYNRLMRKGFWDDFQEAMKKFGEENIPNRAHQFWQRLEGKNTYCAKTFIPAGQVKQTSKGGDRYTQLNYCWNFHGTVECRLFPWFETKELADKAIRALLDCVESYLAKVKKEKEKSVLFKFYSEKETVTTKQVGKLAE